MTVSLTVFLNWRIAAADQGAVRVSSPTSASFQQSPATRPPSPPANTPFATLLKTFSDGLTGVVGRVENLALSVAGLSPSDGSSVEGNSVEGNSVEPGFDFDTALEAFQDALHKGLRDAGIDTLDDLALQLDEQGRIVVAEDHPDRAAIEQFFREHPEWVEQFERLADHAPRPDDGKQFQLRLSLFGPEVEFV